MKAMTGCLTALDVCDRTAGVARTCVRANQQKLFIGCTFLRSTKIVDVMTPAQCRAARALLDMNQTQLAEAASVGLSTIVDFEKKRREVSEAAIAKMRLALERAGIEFLPENGGGEGLRVRRARTRKKS
jgi:DNA-binding transcriptional regulator YiaG